MRSVCPPACQPSMPFSRFESAGQLPAKEGSMFHRHEFVTNWVNTSTWMKEDALLPLKGGLKL